LDFLKKLFLVSVLWAVRALGVEMAKAASTYF